MKRGFTLVELLAILVILAIMILIALPSLTDMTKKTEENKSQEALNNIYMATENYIMANYDNSLDTVGGFTYVNIIRDLIGQNYIDINTLNPNTNLSFSSDDAVKITRNEDWTFSYELTTSKTLIGLLLEQYDSSNTTGLLEDSTNSNIYYFKGTNDEVSNNYLWYGGHHWRVVEFDISDNTVLLISQQPLTSIQPAVNAWDDQESYEKSYVARWLETCFYNSLASSIQNNILFNTFNVGIGSNVSEITTTQKVGLLDVEQYKRAGEQNSYLDIKDDYWLGNRSSSSCIFAVGTVGDGDWEGFTTVNSYGIRPVIRINDVEITGGNGTLTSNYKTNYRSTSTSNVQVGEYINVPYSSNDGACGSDNLCTFRVVSKDSDSIKVVLNGLLSSTSVYGDTMTITTSHTIYTSLNAFADNISTTYRYAGSNKTFYIGDYPSGASYTDVWAEILYATVGLPTVGEMFSGNDIDMSLPSSNSKTFVDANTIENSATSYNYWTMNRNTSSYVRIVTNYGQMINNGNQSYKWGVRPVIFLKSNLTFTGGNGTAESPYELQ